jgi:hypothetical protein
MSGGSAERNRRTQVIDDNREIFDDFRRILSYRCGYSPLMT